MTAFENDTPRSVDRPKDGRDLRFAGGLSVGLVSAILAGGALIAPVSGGLDDAQEARDVGTSIVTLPNVRQPDNAAKPGGPNLATPIAPTPAPVGGTALPFAAPAPGLSPAAVDDAIRRARADADAPDARGEQVNDRRGAFRGDEGLAGASDAQGGLEPIRGDGVDEASRSRTTPGSSPTASRSPTSARTSTATASPTTTSSGSAPIRVTPTNHGATTAWATATATVCATASSPRPARTPSRPTPTTTASRTTCDDYDRTA